MTRAIRIQTWRLTSDAVRRYCPASLGRCAEPCVVVLYAWLISTGAVWIIVVGSDSMADSDPVAVWVVDEVVALCAYEARWSMEIIRINGGPLRLVGVAVHRS